MLKTLRALVPAGAIFITLLASGGVAHAEPTLAQIEEQISAKSTELEKVVEQYNMINEQLAGTRAEIDKLQQSLGPLQQRAVEAKQRVSEIAQTAYRGAGMNGVGAVLSSGSPQTTMQRLGALSQLASTQKQELSVADTATADFAKARKALQDKQVIEDGRAKTLESQKQGIESELSKLNQLKIKARGTATTSGSSYSGPIPSIPGSAGVAVTFAYGAIGKPYVWAADGPDGYDCSGLTLAAWREAGVSLSHNAAQQWNQVAHIGRGDLAAGDLVFYASLGHVAIYVGDGKVIHAPTFGDVVKISNVDMMSPYGYGRVRT